MSKEEQARSAIPVTPTPDHDAAPSRLALRPREAAVALGISQRKLWSLTNQGLVPHLKLGTATLYPVGLLRDWLAMQAKGGDCEI